MEQSVQLHLRNCSYGAVVGADNCRRPIDVEDEGDLAEELALVYLAHHLQLVHVVEHADLALALRHEVQLVTLAALLEDGVVREHEHGLDIGNNLINASLILLEDAVLLYGLLKDNTLHLVAQILVDQIEELVQLNLVVQISLRGHEEVTHRLSDARWHCHVLHRRVRHIKLLLEVLTATIQVGR